MKKVKQMISTLERLSLMSVMGVLITGCASSFKAYQPIAHRPLNPQNVVVKVSLERQMIYVMEGSRPLLVTATCVGEPDKKTPAGRFRVTKKNAQKRSGTYGFWVRGNQIVSGNVKKRPLGGGWRYVGYPMAYWVEFLPGYGFHQGYVWPQPRTHGCLRLHKNAAPLLYNLVRVGTPIHIAQHQAEDLSLGSNHQRPTDYLESDPPKTYLISSAVFTNNLELN